MLGVLLIDSVCVTRQESVWARFPPAAGVRPGFTEHA